MKEGECFILTARIPQSDEKPASDRPEHVVMIKYSDERHTYPEVSLEMARIKIQITSLTRTWSSETWEATYNSSPNYGASVRLSNGFIGLPEELQGRRIGTWVMDEIVSWAKQWPDALIEPIKLSKQQATDDNKLRRNRFYNQFGFQFDLETEEESSSPNFTASQLNTVKKPENIEKMLPEEKIRALLQERDMLRIRLEHCQNSHKNDLENVKKSCRIPKVWFAILGSLPIVFAISIWFGL